MPQRLGCCDGTEPWRRTSLAADLLTEARGEADKLATPLTEDDLVDLFGRLGAPSPEDWARSQVTEGIPSSRASSFSNRRGRTLCLKAIQHGSRMRSGRQSSDPTTHMPGWAQHLRDAEPLVRHPTTSQRLPAVSRRDCFLLLRTSLKARRMTRILTWMFHGACLRPTSMGTQQNIGSGTSMNRCWNSTRLVARCDQSYPAKT